MCNLYKARASRDELARTFDAAPSGVHIDADAAIYPESMAPVVGRGHVRRGIAMMRWGFPTTRPNKRDPSKTVTEYWTNCRHPEKNLWRKSVLMPERRCLVPVSEFAEPDPSRGKGGNAWFEMVDGRLFAFAGIWQPTDRGPHFAFLTTEPNAIVAPIHPKAMPVILQPDDYDHWLDGEPAEKFQHPFPSQLMRLRPFTSSLPA